MPVKPCISCGTLTRNGSYCPAHEPVNPTGFYARPSPSSRNRLSPARRRRIKERDAHRCQRCGTEGSEDNPLRVHHRSRVADGGGHEETNLETVCDGCHAAVHKSN